MIQDYALTKVGSEETEAFDRLMHSVWETMENRDLFAVGDLDADWVRAGLSENGGFGVAARTPSGELAGMLMVCCYGNDAENLGHDLGYPPEALASVCNFECAAVLPEHRGHGLERRMFAFAEACLRGTGIRTMAMTVSPDNPASLRSAEKAGFRIVMTKEKYGGLMRHVLVKPVNSGEGDSLTAPKAMADQYGTADRLKTRISIHTRYSVNKQGFGPWITEHYRFPEGASVLELGCGTGEMWLGREGLIRRCSRLILSDISEGMLAQARETLRDMPGMDFLRVDIQDIPFPDHSFDAVIANMMLYHVPDLTRGLREVRRVLKEDGVFYCATFGENGMMAHLCRMFGLEDTEKADFTLQNGAEKLRPFFPNVELDLYEDALAVTDAEDMADYIASLSGMSALRSLPRERIRSVLEAHMEDGVLHVPKEYGLFVAR